MDRDPQTQDVPQKSASKQRAPAASRARLVVAFAALYVFWGSTYLGSKFAMAVFPPWLLGGIRFTAAGLIMGAWLLSTGRARRQDFASPRLWMHAAVAGVLFFAVANAMVSMGVQRIPSGLAALIVAMTSVFIVLLDRLVMRAGAPSWSITAGMVLGVAGVVVLGGPSHSGPAGELDTVGVVLVACSTLAWASATVYGKHAPRSDSLLATSAMQMVAGGVAAFVLSVMFERSAWPAAGSVTLGAVAAVAYLVTFGSLVGFTAYVFLLQHVNAAGVATYAYVNPLVALVLGTALAGEVLPPRTWIAAPLILGSVALIQFVRPPSKDQAPVEEE
ncbi:MAG: EamA family transporter [Phycisphaerales bacterium]